MREGPSNCRVPARVASLVLKEVTHHRVKATDRDLWNRWPFLLLVLACLGAEWAIRKKQGLP